MLSILQIFAGNLSTWSKKCDELFEEKQKLWCNIRNNFEAKGSNDDKNKFYSQLEDHVSQLKSELKKIDKKWSKQSWILHTHI